MNRLQISRFIRREWRSANEKYFGGLLPRVPLRTGDLRKPYHLAQFNTYSTGETEIVFCYCLNHNATEKELRYTLIHEMIHLQQEIHHSPNIRKEIHGRFFQRRHKEIFGAPYKIGFMQK